MARPQLVSLFYNNIEVKNVDPLQCLLSTRNCINAHLLLVFAPLSYDVPLLDFDLELGQINHVHCLAAFLGFVDSLIDDTLLENFTLFHICAVRFNKVSEL